MGEKLYPSNKHTVWERRQDGLSGIRDYLSFRGDEISAPFDLLHHTDGNLIEIRHLPDDMRFFGFLGEQIATTGYPVL